MKSIFLVVVLLSSPAFAKKPTPVQSTVANLKPTHLERAEMFEGQVINAQAAALQAEQQKLQTRVTDFQARVKGLYGVDFSAGDQVNFETGVIAWHIEVPKGIVSPPVITVPNASKTQ